MFFLFDKEDFKGFDLSFEERCNDGPSWDHRAICTGAEDLNPDSKLE
jgi:hypothetical protein